MQIQFQIHVYIDLIFFFQIMVDDICGVQIKKKLKGIREIGCCKVLSSDCS